MNLRTPLAAVALAVLALPCSAAAPKDIDAAVQKGAAYLKQQYGGPQPLRVDEISTGVGAAALAGLALLEAGTAADDASVAGIAAAVRSASFGEARTYHITLCLLFLDRLGDPADVPLIQMLGVRLVAGQNAAGGWTYDCGAVELADMKALRTALMNAELRAGARPPAEAKAPATPALPAAPVGKLHAVVEKYAAKLASSRDRTRGDDNSNTQFGILGTWVARRHGVPADAALVLIEKRFLTTQTGTGGWPYSGFAQGSPSMTCAGLLGLATAIGLREERRLKADAPHKPAPAPVAKANPATPVAKSDDPFFNPVPVPKSADPFFDPPAAVPEPKAKDAPKPKAGPAKPPADPRDIAIARGLAALGRALEDAPEARGRGAVARGLGDRDFYFLWSLERVGVVFGLEKIGGTDWYQFGADGLVASQRANGSWGKGARGEVVDTSFAVLFLSRSNFVRDLSARVAKDPANAELRAARDPAPAVVPAPEPKPPVAVASAPVSNVPVPAAVPAPAPAADARTVAADLVGTSDADWDAALLRVRDGKGAAHTQALVAAAGQLDGERRRAVREALAERLTRMSADTLRGMAKADEVELRRAAVLAMAMKDDAAHLPDLVVALADTDGTVAKAARAGLKGVTGEDFGPEPDATPAERAASIRAWADWIRKRR